MSAPGIRRRLAMLVFAAAAPALLLGAGLLALEHRHDRETFERDTIATARAMANAIDRELVSITAAAQALATSQRARSGDLSAFYEQAQQVVSSKLAFNVVLSDASGRQVMNTLRPPGEPLPAHGNPAQLQAVFAAARPVVSDLYRDGVLDRPVMSVDVPVLSDGKVVLGLSIGEQPERFRAILSEQRLPPGWIGVVFDTTGTIVARTHEHERFVGQKGAAELVARMARDTEGALEVVTVEGIPVLSAFSRSPASGWTVALGIPRDALSAPLWRRTRVGAAAAGMLLALGLLLAWAIGGSIARSIRALEAAAAGIGRGEQIVVPPLGLREADELGAALAHASRMIAAAEHRAHHDPLTGLANRALFQELLAQQVALCRRRGGRLSVLFIDLDGFKGVNDTLGHEAGDALLCEVALRIKGAVRASDVAARLGGDEFAVLLDDADHGDATTLAAKVSEMLSRPYESVGAMSMSASVGGATYPEAGRSADELLRHADEAMYRVKESRRMKRSA